MNKYLIDTNVLLENPSIISAHNSVILSHVIRELEKHKLSKNNELAFQARQATRHIEENVDTVTFDFKDYKVEDNRLDGDYVDNKIIQACIEKGYGLITNDLLLKIKARGYDIEVVESTEKKAELDYTGIYKLYITDSKEDQELLSNLYTHNKPQGFELLTNQYLIIYDKNKPLRKEDGTVDYEVIDKLRYDGEQLVRLNLPHKKIVSPKNAEQSCAIDLLNNTDVPIKIIAGTYGSGKTYLTVKTALNHVMDEGYHSKIMVIRNPLGSGESIGWLKGTKEDKTQDFFKPFIQHLDGGEQQATYLEQCGKLIKEIPYYIKGLSIEDTFVMVDEAEDLDSKLIKLIGTRLAERSAITFAGDFKQAEDKFLHNNGLLKTINALKGDPLVGIVVMSEDVRSEASKVFAEM